jgi:hypothetical protein
MDAGVVMGFLDMLWFEGIEPLAAAAGGGLERFFLEPMRLLRMDPLLQVFVVAAATAALSLALKRSLRISAKEASFRRRFDRRQRSRKDMLLLEDPLLRRSLLQAADGALDEEYNTYLAEMFALRGAGYLLPVLCALWWLDGRITTGSIPIPLVFMAGYAVAITGMITAGRLWKLRVSSPSGRR